MRVHVLYFYQLINELTQNDVQDGLILSSPLVASIDRTIKRAISEKVRPFELQQDRLLGLINFSDALGIKITNIEFTTELDPDLEDELQTAIQNQDYRKMKAVITEIKFDFSIDILALSYMQDGRPYRITKFAVAEIPADYMELPSLAFSPPIAFATGISKYSVERV
ncbi:hypothetical protein [Schinkia azotoformans]|uniref:hypothetical protein n=1 Tax=Schinkia azotoformans TaxID=1454 RepID=UPI002DB8DE14|nr:hypothetical protein [Schinkia azotoformans]MEC1718444.1 hypothetical protein [Schinkia azotoformans]MEC1759818.1 hypothetical protein [Schinkia azotoformans]